MRRRTNQSNPASAADRGETVASVRNQRLRTSVAAILASATAGGIAAPATAHEYDPKLALVRDAYERSSSDLDTLLRSVVQTSRRHPQQAPSAAGDSNGQAPVFELRIPAGALGDVASALERATAKSVTLANPSIAVVYSPGVSGRYTFAAAVAAILDGTGLTFRVDAPGGSAVLQLPAFAGDVSVIGNLPTVSSPKYTTPLREVPQTIEVIPRAAMAAQGVTTLSEALRNVPGVTLQAGEGGGASNTAGDMFNMRGFNASNSLFVDNVRDDGLVSRDVFNLEQIEVFMGPTGSDVGRGTASGYVNMQTKVPHGIDATAATLTYGSAAQRRATFDVNRTVGNGNSWLERSAVRLNGLWQDSGVAGRDEVENETMAIAPALTIGVGLPMRVIASAQILRQDNVPDYGIPGAGWSGDPLTTTTEPTPNPVDQSNYYGSPAFDFDHSNQHTVTLRVERDFNEEWAASNQTRYNQTHREAVISTIQNPAAYNPTTHLVTIARQGNERENSIASNQTNLRGGFSTGGLPHTVSGGLEFTREQQFTPTLAGVGTRPAVDIYNPNPADPVTGYAPARTGAFTQGHTRTVALYGFDTLPVTSRLQVQGGLRWEHYQTDFRSVDASGTSLIDESGSDNLLSGKAGVVVKVTAEMNVYASYGTTLTPPGSANFSLSSAANNQNNPNVEPRKSANAEIGAKWDTFGGRLSVNAAAFHTVNENVLFTVDAAAVPPVYNQDDKQRVDGITLGASGSITSGWQLMTSFGVLDSENLSQNIANSGKRLTLTPEYSGSVWSTYRLPSGWTLGGGVRATSKVFINAANTIESPGYYVVDGLVEYVVNQHLTLRANIYNLTDAIYIRNVNNNGGRYNPGYPRTAQLTSVVTF